MNSVTYIDLLKLMRDGNEPQKVYYAGVEFELIGGTYYNHEHGVLRTMNTERRWAEMGEVIYFRTELLDEADEEYLKNIIRPFRDRFQYLEIIKLEKGKEEKLVIGIIESNGHRSGYLSFPSFTAGRCFPMLKRQHMYQSLEELGLMEW